MSTAHLHGGPFDDEYREIPGMVGRWIDLAVPLPPVRATPRADPEPYSERSFQTAVYECVGKRRNSIDTWCYEWRRTA